MRFSSILLLTMLFCCFAPALSQSTQSKPKLKTPPFRRINFAEAQKLLVGETEGNLQKQVTREVLTFSLTRLTSGKILELYHPVTSNIPNKKGPITVPGYGVLWESETNYNEAKSPRHALEELIPDAKSFIATVPQLVTRLEKRLGTKLDYSRASLRRLDTLMANYQGKYSFNEMGMGLFQEMTAYYGETLRRTLNGEWQAADERVSKTRTYVAPDVSIPAANNKRKLLKPWGSLLTVLYDETKKGTGVTLAFDADMATR